MAVDKRIFKVTMENHQTRQTVHYWGTFMQIYGFIDKHATNVLTVSEIVKCVTENQPLRISQDLTISNSVEINK